MRFQKAKNSHFCTSSNKKDCGEPVSLHNRKPVSAEDIQAWLISKVSEQLELDPDEIDIYEPFASYGLTSMTAVSLSGDLENWFQIKLSPTLTWDYPTIETLAQYLDGKVNVSVSNPELKVNLQQGTVVKWSL